MAGAESAAEVVQALSAAVAGADMTEAAGGLSTAVAAGAVAEVVHGASAAAAGARMTEAAAATLSAAAGELASGITSPEETPSEW